MIEPRQLRYLIAAAEAGSFSRAARFLEVDEPMQCHVEIADGLPTGEHRFALYRWAKHGIRPDEELVVVADDPEVERQLVAVLPNARQATCDGSLENGDFDDLDGLHHAKWVVAQADHIALNQQLAEHRVQSLTVIAMCRRNGPPIVHCKALMSNGS